MHENGWQRRGASKGGKVQAFIAGRVTSGIPALAQARYLVGVEG